MHEIRHILALIADGPRADTVLALAARLARERGATVQALHIGEPLVGGAYLSPEAAAIAIQYADEVDRGRRQVAAERVDSAGSLHGIKIELTQVEGDPLAAAVNAARCSDLVVLAQRADDDGSAARLAPGLLVRAGRPLLFVPAVDAGPAAADGAPRCGQRVIVAWAPTRECTRALGDALPLLAAASHVELVRLARPDEDPAADPLPAVCAHLKRHGIDAQPRLLAQRSGPPTLGSGWTPDVPVAEALLSHAADTDADLIVMGGYGHTRLWELALGGVTRTMLASMTVPVLMSH